MRVYVTDVGGGNRSELLLAPPPPAVLWNSCFVAVTFALKIITQVSYDAPNAILFCVVYTVTVCIYK